MQGLTDASKAEQPNQVHLSGHCVLQVYRPKPRGTTKLVTVKGKKVKIIKEDYTAGAAVVHVVNRVSGKHNPPHLYMPTEWLASVFCCGLQLAHNVQLTWQYFPMFLPGPNAPSRIPIAPAAQPNTDLFPRDEYYLNRP